MSHREKAVKPEVEIYSNSDVDDVAYLMDRGVLTKPCCVGFVPGIHRMNNQAFRYSPKRAKYRGYPSRRYKGRTQ